jgi:hypothetical protein
VHEVENFENDTKQKFVKKFHSRISKWEKDLNQGVLQLEEILRVEWIKRKKVEKKNFKRDKSFL